MLGRARVSWVRKQIAAFDDSWRGAKGSHREAG